MSSNHKKNYVIYDGYCSFCCKWIQYWETELTLDDIQFVPFQNFDNRKIISDYQIEDFQKEIFLLYDDKIYQGAKAIFKLYHIGNKKKFYRLYKYFPGFAIFSNLFYYFIARNRHLFSKIVKPPNRTK